MATNVKQMMEAANAAIPKIGIAEAKSMMAKGALVVDVRDAKEFAGGTMKGAVNLPINDLEKKVNTLPKNRPVVFVCGTGARSGEAYDMVKLLAGDVQAYFIDAEIKFGGDGTYTMVEKK